MAAIPKIESGAHSGEGTAQSWGHIESWLIRVVLLALMAYQAVMHNRSGVTVAAEGLVFSFFPLVVQRFSNVHVPRRVELAFALAIGLQFVSESLKLYEIFTYWDKFTHPAEVFLATACFAQLFLGYVDTYGVRLHRTFIAAVTMLFGATLGASWEFLEFATDWFGNADLQKSNADTMTDILGNDIGAILATLLAFWAYHHWHTSDQRREHLGKLARWLTNGTARLLDRHGRIVAAIAFALLAGICLAAWYVDRNPPGVPPGMAQGRPAAWSFAPGGPDSGAQQMPQVLLGDWQTRAQGLCRANVEPPRPGSEKPGLIALAPGTLFAPDRGFAASARLTEERPRFGQGSQMTAGIAFGIRSPKDFYLLEASFLHDFVRLDRFIHGRRRDLREERARTHGNEWHELQVRVQGDRIEALIDGQPKFDYTGAADASGGLGLWARVTASACFSDARIDELSRA